MKYPVLFCIMPLLLAACGDEPPMENVLTLETTVGGSELPAEYDFTRPRGFAVDDSGNVYIADGNALKVFDRAGEPAGLLGDYDSQPAQYRNMATPAAGPNGYVGVLAGRLLDRYHVYAPDRTHSSAGVVRGSDQYAAYIDGIGYEFGFLSEVVPVNETVRLVEMVLTDVSASDPFRMYYSLAYETGAVLKELVRYNASNIANTGGRLFFLPYRGQFFHEVMPDRRIVYSAPYFDRGEQNGEHTYTIFMQEIASGDRIELRHEYTPVFIPDPEKKRFLDMADDPAMKEVVRNVNQEVMTYPPLYNLQFDGGLVFAFTFLRNDRGDFLVDVFDAAAAEYLRSAYFNVSGGIEPAAIDIRNGRYFQLGTTPEGRFILEKYRIDPALYSRK